MRKSEQADKLVIHRPRDLDDIRPPPARTNVSSSLHMRAKKLANAYRPLTANKKGRDAYKVDSPSPSKLNLSHSASKSVSFSQSVKVREFKTTNKQSKEKKMI